MGLKGGRSLYASEQRSKHPTRAIRGLSHILATNYRKKPTGSNTGLSYQKHVTAAGVALPKARAPSYQKHVDNSDDQQAPGDRRGARLKTHTPIIQINFSLWVLVADVSKHRAEPCLEVVHPGVAETELIL